MRLRWDSATSSGVSRCRLGRPWPMEAKASTPERTGCLLTKAFYRLGGMAKVDRDDRPFDRGRSTVGA